MKKKGEEVNKILDKLDQKMKDKDKKDERI